MDNNFKNIILNRDVDKLFRLLELAEEENYDSFLSEKEIEELNETLRILVLNNGKVNDNITFTQEQLSKLNYYLLSINGYDCEFKDILDSSDSLGLDEVNELLDTLSNDKDPSNIANSDVIETKEKSILTKQEKNDLIATYGRSDIYLYAIRIDNINAISIFTDDYKEKRNNERFFSSKFSHRSLNSLGYGLGKDLLEIGDSYTLLKYLGDNKFQEFYTGKIITIFRESVENPASFLIKFDQYKENPLCILTGLKDLEVPTKDIERSIVNNARNRERIIEIINKANTLASKALDKDLEQLVSDDYLYAKEEDNIYEFKKIK